MEIAIRNYLSGSVLLENEPNVWDAIIILDTGISPTEFVAKHAKRHLYLRFDDITSNTPGKRTPTAEDLQSALDFAAESENLLVCCRAGQSRSAATAFIICHQRLGADAARGLLQPERHIPNSLLVDLAAQALNDSSILDTFNQWRTEHQHIKLSDHMDAIEREFDELESQGGRNRIVH